MEFKTEITSKLNEEKIRELFPMVVEELKSGHERVTPEMLSKHKIQHDVIFETLLCKNGGAIYLRDGTENSLDSGRYESYSWGMVVVTENKCEYYQLSDDLNHKTFPLEEHQAVMASLGPEIPKEKKPLLSKQTVPNPEYARAFNKLVELAAVYSEQMQAKKR